jgi:hypothetical protein
VSSMAVGAIVTPVRRCGDGWRGNCEALPVWRQRTMRRQIVDGHGEFRRASGRTRQPKDQHHRPDDAPHSRLHACRRAKARTAILRRAGPFGQAVDLGRDARKAVTCRTNRRATDRPRTPKIRSRRLVNGLVTACKRLVTPAHCTMLPSSGRGVKSLVADVLVLVVVVFLVWVVWGKPGKK